MAPLSSLPYTAKIEGISDPSLREAMENSCLTLLPSDKNTASLNALKLRANDDIDRINNVAIYYGYFDCHIETTIVEGAVPHVIFTIQLGKRFLFGQLTLIWNDEDMVQAEMARQGSDTLLLAKGPTPKDAPSFQPQKTATGMAITAIDGELIKSLRSRAFAFAKVVTKSVVADRESGEVDLTIEVQTGPIVRFGPTNVVGAQNVKPIVFSVNQEWKEGDLYSPKALEKTENSLQKSGLFQSIQIEEAKDLGNDWTLPITVYATESKQRTIGAGANYTTTYGGGLSAEWEHRNMQGKGRKLSTELELWQKMRSASATYTIPHFMRSDENLLWILEYDHQNYLPFTSSAINGSALLDRQITPRTEVIYGLRLERLESTGIIGHQLYHLFKIPLQLGWSNANSPFDPTKGMTLNIHLTPSYQFLFPHYKYLINTSSLAGYKSFADNLVTFAAKVGIGNIIGASNNSIPLPDRFFGGSQNSLRGYKTGSVSPLNEYGKPIGGRSMLTGSFEIRARSKSLGWVAFYDVGNVYRHVIPQAERHPILQSVGVGLRYSTPIGPLRLDIAFPLQRRKSIDPVCQLYFSIGQAF